MTLGEVAHCSQAISEEADSWRLPANSTPNKLNNQSFIDGVAHDIVLQCTHKKYHPNWDRLKHNTINDYAWTTSPHQVYPDPSKINILTYIGEGDDVLTIIIWVTEVIMLDVNSDLSDSQARNIQVILNYFYFPLYNQSVL